MPMQIDYTKINSLDIKDILVSLWIQVNNRNQIYYPSLVDKFDDKYRVDTRNTNAVVNFWNMELPTGKPFYFIKSFFTITCKQNFSDKDTFDWFKKYLWMDIDKTFSKDIIPHPVRTFQKIDDWKEEEYRKDIIEQFKRMKQTFSTSIIEYFQNRWISLQTLVNNWARVWEINIDWKTYRNRVFFPMIDWMTNLIVGVKARNIFAQPWFPKTMNVPHSKPDLLFIKDNINTKFVFVCEWEIDKLSLDEIWLKNSIWNLAWVQTFKEEWKDLFDRYDKIYLFYENDQQNVAWLDGMINFIQHMPNKKFYCIDYDYLVDNYFFGDDEIKHSIKDINDILKYSLLLWKNNYEICEMISKSCRETNIEILVENSIVKLNEIIATLKSSIDNDTSNLNNKIKSLSNLLEKKRKMLTHFTETSIVQSKKIQ